MEKMNETEEQIRQTIDRLLVRQSALATEYAMVTQAIKSLEKLLGVELSDAELEVSTNEAPTVPQKSQESRLPKFESTAFFGLNQRDAVVKILKTAGKPLSMLQILKILKEANYPFKTKAPYQSLYPLMKKDPEIVKHGNLWGLKKATSTSGLSSNGLGNKIDEETDNDPENPG
jgi:hypothetical protein